MALLKLYPLYGCNNSGIFNWGLGCLGRPIRGQYPGHMIPLDQSEASVQLTCNNSGIFIWGHVWADKIWNLNSPVECAWCRCDDRGILFHNGNGREGWIQDRQTLQSSKDLFRKEVRVQNSFWTRSSRLTWHVRLNADIWGYMVEESDKVLYMFNCSYLFDVKNVFNFMFLLYWWIMNSWKHECLSYLFPINYRRLLCWFSLD